MEKVNGSLYEAIFKAQQQVENAKKKSQNPHLKSKYADLKSVQEAIGSALVDNGLLVIKRPVDSTEKELKLSIGLIHLPSGESMWWEATMPIEKPTPQGFGSAMTYMRRYIDVMLWDLLSEDDDAEGAMNRTGAIKPVISLTKPVAA